MTNKNKTNNAMSNEYKTTQYHALIDNLKVSMSDENLISFAQACVFSVLNKIYSASGNENILRIRAQVASHEDETLVNTAVVAILEEYEAQMERWSSTTYLPDDKSAIFAGCCGMDLEEKYEKRVLNKKIYIQEDPEDCFKTITTTPIQEVYKAVRREIDNAGSVKADTNGYSYISLSVHDDESGIDEMVYKRYGKYADIGGYVKDYNGADTVYTADETTAQDIDTLLTSLDLTARQAQIIKYRLQGYGYKAIATKLGVSVSTVRTHLECIQAKAVEIGLGADK